MSIYAKETIAKIKTLLLYLCGCASGNGSRVVVVVVTGSDSWVTISSSCTLAHAVQPSRLAIPPAHIQHGMRRRPHTHTHTLGTLTRTAQHTRGAPNEGCCDTMPVRAITGGGYYSPIPRAPSAIAHAKHHRSTHGHHNQRLVVNTQARPMGGARSRAQLVRTRDVQWPSTSSDFVTRHTRRTRDTTGSSSQ